MVAKDPEAIPTVVPSALPSWRARALAVVAIVVAGACGGLIGWSFASVQCNDNCTLWNGIGLLTGAAVASVGVAVVAVLTLRAMDEWQTTATRERKRLDDQAS